MTRQISFTHLEQAITPGFRDRMDRAESAEDVRKFFAEMASTLLSDALGKPEAVRFEDVVLAPGVPNGYTISEAILEVPAFKETWEGSDLSRIIATFARSAVHRYNHLHKTPLRTEAKMFHNKKR